MSSCQSQYINRIKKAKMYNKTIPTRNIRKFLYSKTHLKYGTYSLKDFAILESSVTFFRNYHHVYDKFFVKR